MSCRFCDLVSSSGQIGTADQVLVENEDFFAISSIGGFISGWTLVCPKKHQLNLSKQYTNDSFIKFINQVQEVVSNEYGKCVIFEHGAISEGSQTACGANHAHLHIVPFSGNLESLAQVDAQDLNWDRCSINQIAKYSNESEYLFCANVFEAKNTVGLFSILQEPQSQFFRRVLAKSVGLTEFFDYKRYPFNEISRDTTKRLVDGFITMSVM